MEKPKVSEQDLIDLMICGKSYLGRNKNLFYSLKNKILEAYGMFYGYCLQSWYDTDNWSWDEHDQRDIYAAHHHILKIYYLSTQDGKFISHCFHSPTDEFWYWNEDGVDRKSSGYNDLVKQCREEFKMEGKKSRSFDRDDTDAGWKALKRLVRKYGFSLKLDQARGRVFTILQNAYLLPETELDSMSDLLVKTVSRYR